MTSNTLFWQHWIEISLTIMGMYSTIVAIIFIISHISWVSSAQIKQKINWKHLLYDAVYGAAVGALISLIPISVIITFHYLAPAN